MNERFEAKEAEDLYILRKMFFLPSLLHIYIYFAQNVHFFFIQDVSHKIFVISNMMYNFLIY